MSKYFDGLAWFELLLHINQQAESCALLCGKKSFGEFGSRSTKLHCFGSLSEALPLTVFISENLIDQDYYHYLIEKILQEAPFEPDDHTETLDDSFDVNINTITKVTNLEFTGYVGIKIGFRERQNFFRDSCSFIL